VAANSWAAFSVLGFSKSKGVDPFFSLYFSHGVSAILFSLAFKYYEQQLDPVIQAGKSVVSWFKIINFSPSNLACGDTTYSPYGY
jgi:hypothetical protein